MAEQSSERRPGDWLHRDLRSRESVNRIVKTEKERTRRWYQDTFWVIFFLFFFWPVGMYLMWKYTKWPIPVKAIVTIAIAILVVIMFNVNMAVQSMTMGGVS